MKLSPSQEAVMPIPKIKTHSPNFFLRKSDFGLKNKAHDFEDATWSWITKRGYKPYGSGDPESGRNITLNKIKVSVWPEHHKPYDPNLDMDFEPNHEGLAGAKKYARTAIEIGGVMAEIRMEINFPWKFGVLVQSELYSLDEPDLIDPRDL
jgi:hypothetical protein